MGYMVGRVFISMALIPAYFKGEMYTAYELMQRRFGPRIKHATASMFLVTRALAEGVRVLAIATVVGVVLGTGDVWSILIISGLTLLYTFEGGLTAVIWTDVVQLGIYIGGTLVTFCRDPLAHSRRVGRRDGQRRPQVRASGISRPTTASLTHSGPACSAGHF